MFCDQQEPPGKHCVSRMCPRVISAVTHGYRTVLTSQHHDLTNMNCLQQLSSVTDPEAATSEYNLVENINVCLCLDTLPGSLSVSFRILLCLTPLTVHDSLQACLPLVKGLFSRGSPSDSQS